jgi:hypothetical protein
VNSLYPYVKANFSTPIGLPKVFDRNIRKVEPDAFGYFYCEISSPDNLINPVLQRKVKTSNGIRTIAGSWEGWIFMPLGSEEKAMKYGYHFEIMHGYQFEKGNVFKEYIEVLYKYRLDYPKTNPMNYIAKLLMNSLYRKFGMKVETTEVSVFDLNDPLDQELFKDTFEHWAESIKDIQDIDNFKILIRNTIFAYKYNEELDMFHALDVNIAIASSITAYARIFMSNIKNVGASGPSNIKIYYSDTDSIVIDSELPEQLVGKALGQVKLEHIIKRADSAIAPKVYGIEDTDGNVTIKGISSKVTDN